MKHLEAFFRLSAILGICAAFLYGCGNAIPTSSTAPAYSLGDTQIRPADEMLMVYVPGGVFK